VGATSPTDAVVLEVGVGTIVVETQAGRVVVVGRSVVVVVGGNVVVVLWMPSRLRWKVCRTWPPVLLITMRNANDVGFALVAFQTRMYCVSVVAHGLGLWLQVGDGSGAVPSSFNWQDVAPLSLATTATLAPFAGITLGVSEKYTTTGFGVEAEVALTNDGITAAQAAATVTSIFPWTLRIAISPVCRRSLNAHSNRPCRPTQIIAHLCLIEADGKIGV
jgi:hypothetical protein